MSFSCYFTARSKAHAEELLEQQTYLPGEVKAFIRTAVKNLPAHDGVRLIRVSAVGHLCDGPSSCTSSNAEIKVEPVVANG